MIIDAARLPLHFRYRYTSSGLPHSPSVHISLTQIKREARKNKQLIVAMLYLSVFSNLLMLSLVVQLWLST